MTTELAPTNGHTEAGPLPFRALHNFVLIEPVVQRNTAGGLALPDGAARGDLPMGVIRSIGDGHHTENGVWVETRLKAGQTVYLAFPDKMGVVKVQLQGKDFLLVHEGEIAGIVPEQEAAA